ncbi:MAG: hypothetical protein H0V39_00305 [Nitrosomonas sp.]|nr:hypothetical protein [Nitrosomonas sp.]
MKTLQLIVERETGHAFYVKDVETGNILKIKKSMLEDLSVEDGGLLNITTDSMISIDCEVDLDQATVLTINNIKDEILADTDREKVLVEAGKYKIGDIYDGSLIFDLGKEITTSTKKMQYLYFSVLKAKKEVDKDQNGFSWFRSTSL